MNFLSTCKLFFIASLTIIISTVPITSTANNTQTNVQEDKSIHMKGEIIIDGKSLPLILHLSYPEGANSYEGFYYYLKDLRPKILSTEYNPDKKLISDKNVIKLIDEDAIINLSLHGNKASGTWTSKTDKKTGNISLETLKEPDTNRLIIIPSYKPGPKLNNISIELEQKNGALGFLLAVSVNEISNKQSIQKLLNYEQYDLVSTGWMDNTIDYNSDGVKDFSWKSEQMMYSNNNYDVWIFDSQTSQFKKLEVEFEGSFCNPAPDLKKKELTIGCITGSAGLEYHNARFSFNNEKLILVEHNLGSTSEKKDEAIFQVIKALTPGSPLMNICECSYNTITRKIKKCSVQKEKCKNFLPTTGD